MGSRQANSHAAVIEDRLGDPESSVRIAAAAALAGAHRPESPARLLSALEADGTFQIRQAAVDALAAMGDLALPAALGGCESRSAAVREVCARALAKLGRDAALDRVLAPLRRLALDAQETEAVRYYAIEGFVGLRATLTADQHQSLATDLISLTDPAIPSTVRLRAAWGLGHLNGRLDSTRQAAVLQALEQGFRGYGDGATRGDAAFGWRVFGNALLQHHEPGRNRLEAMRTQREDRWLAWLAYEVVHVPQRSGAMVLCSESEAVRVHREFAPPFPGWRRW